MTICSPHPFQILNSIQSLYWKLGLPILKVTKTPLHHVPKSSAPYTLHSFGYTSSFHPIPKSNLQSMYWNLGLLMISSKGSSLPCSQILCMPPPKSMNKLALNLWASNHNSNMEAAILLAQLFNLLCHCNPKSPIYWFSMRLIWDMTEITLKSNAYLWLANTNWMGLLYSEIHN